MAADINLTFTAQRLDYVFNVLAQRPFAEVQDIIADIRNQVVRQQPQPPQVVQDFPTVTPDAA